MIERNFSADLNYLDELYDYLSEKYGIANAAKICEHDRMRAVITEAPLAVLKQIGDEVAAGLIQP